MLIVDTKDQRCSRWAREHMFECGVMIMALGFSMITDDNMKEAAFRRAVWNGLFFAEHPDLPAIEGCPPIEDIAFVKINGNTEDNDKWIRRQKRNFINTLKTKETK